MLRFLPGLVLVQLVVLALYLTNAGGSPEALAVRVAVPALVVTLVTALWFSNLSRIAGERRHAELIERHAREREELKVHAVLERERVKGDAAREREETLERVHREARRNERRVDRMANFKVGLAGLTAVGIGVLFVLSELLTLGLLTITTSAGALGGYLFRWRQGRRAGETVAPAGSPRVVGELGTSAVTVSGKNGGPRGGARAGGRAGD